MADTKKTATVKALEKAEPAAKAEVAKRPVAAVAVTEKAAKAPEKKEEAKAEVKTEVKAAKAPAKKTAAKTTASKTAAKKTPAKKTVKAEAKAPAKKAAVKQIINFQFAGKSYSMEDLVKIAGDVWKFDLHKNDEEYQSLELYVKPEESVAYYVFNGDITGSFFI